MGYVTQSRTFPATEFPTIYSPGGPPTVVYFPTATRTQSTTSWRTGGGNDVPEGSVDTPSTEAGVFNYLVDDSASRDEDPEKPYDRGHTFSTYKQTVDYIDQIVLLGINPSTFQGTYWNGALVPVPVAGYQGLLPPVPSSFSDSAKLGAIAINQTAPTRPSSSFGQGLGELGADGFPGIPGEELRKRIDYFRSLGKEYLNVQFGWIPFINDLKSTCQAIVDRHQLIAQYQRDSGKNVRRAYHFAPKREVTITDPIDGKLSSLLFGTTWENDFRGWSLCETGSAKYQLMTTKETHVYFRGCFTYYLPEGDSFLDRMERNVSLAQRVLSTSLNPELLYQLTPWSWLVDWFTHFGRYISTFSRFATDGLVLRYGYLMAKQSIEYRHILRNVRLGQGGHYGPYRTVELVTSSVRKERFRSTPYGFGIDTSTFTDFQWSILGALGLTKAPKTLKIS